MGQYELQIHCMIALGCEIFNFATEGDEQLIFTIINLADIGGRYIQFVIPTAQCRQNDILLNYRGISAK